MKTVKREIVAAMIISRDGKLLLGKKHADRGGVYVNSWHIPGGGIDVDERPKTALIREVQEETGINVSHYPIKLYDDLGFGESERIYKGEKVLCQMHFTVYMIQIDDQDASVIETSLDDDIEKIEWVELKDLKKYELTPPSIELFKRKGLI
jgi:8-oxo-dGTP diphosphatase